MSPAISCPSPWSAARCFDLTCDFILLTKPTLHLSIELPYHKNTTESVGVGEVVHFVRGEGGPNPSASSGQALDYADVLGGMTRIDF